MIGPAAVALTVWVALTLLSGLAWVRPRARADGELVARPVVLVGVLVVTTLGTAAVAAAASAGPPVRGAGVWVAVAVAAAATTVSGGALATCVLGLVDTAPRPSALGPRLVLRGGAWIGALERLGLLGTLLAGWPEGVAAIVAVKGLARYPELQSAPASGATERFIIGTLVSLGWGSVCAGVAWLLIRPG